MWNHTHTKQRKYSENLNPMTLNNSEHKEQNINYSIKLS